MNNVLAAILGLAILALAVPVHAQTDEELRQIYFRRDFAQMEEIARRGDVRAEAWMGLMLQQASKRIESKSWWRKAAEKGHRRAISNLAEMERVDGYPEEAMRWYRRGAELGYADQQARLARVYREGKIVARNDAEAVRWYRAAAAQRHFPAYQPLAEMIAAGEGAARDPVEAYALAEVASHFQHDQSDTVSIEFANRLKAKLAQEMGSDAITQARRRAHEIRPDLADIIARRARADFIKNAISVSAVVFVLGGFAFAAFVIVRALRRASGSPGAA